MQLPDYHGGSIVNLMASIAQGFGAGPTGYAPVAGLDPDLLSEARNVVLLVIDGLGFRYLQECAPPGELLRHTRRSITSVCPSTTTSAITTFLTGVAPQQHALTGWFTYFSEYGSVLTVLPYSTRVGQLSLDDQLIPPLQLTGQTPLFDRLPVDTHVVTPDWIAQSSFNRAFSGSARIRPYRGLGGLVKSITAASRSGRGRNYIYAYWPEYDSLAHQHGVKSERVATHFQQLEQAFCRLAETLVGTNTRLLVTADHGFIDTTPEHSLRLEAHPGLAGTLMMPLCGEPRLAFCYVHPDRVGQFEHYVGESLAREITLLPSRQMVDQGWFGLGARHPALENRVGHYALVMNDDYSITGCLPGERPLQHRGVHGGVSSWEMLVPLIYLET